jgi:hypothetical protein
MTEQLCKTMEDHKVTQILQDDGKLIGYEVEMEDGENLRFIPNKDSELFRMACFSMFGEIYAKQNPTLHPITL